MDARTDIVAVPALLTAARAIVTDPARWCAWPHALDPDGLTGAINCAVYRQADSLDIPPALQRARECAGAILTDAVSALTLGHYRETTTYNDATNHGCILKAFDIAIRTASD